MFKALPLIVVTVAALVSCQQQKTDYMWMTFPLGDYSMQGRCVEMYLNLRIKGYADNSKCPQPFPVKNFGGNSFSVMGCIETKPLTWTCKYPIGKAMRGEYP